MGNRANSPSCLREDPLTAAQQKEDKMDIDGVALLKIMTGTRNLDFVQRQVRGFWLQLA